MTPTHVMMADCNFPWVGGAMPSIAAPECTSSDRFMRLATICDCVLGAGPAHTRDGAATIGEATRPAPCGANTDGAAIPRHCDCAARCLSAPCISSSYRLRNKANIKSTSARPHSGPAMPISCKQIVPFFHLMPTSNSCRFVSCMRVCRCETTETLQAVVLCVAYNLCANMDMMCKRIL